MTVGSQPNPAQIQANLTSMFVNIRNDFTIITDYNNWIVGSGGQTFLTNAGIAVADAQTDISSLGNMANLAAVYQGTAAVISPNFNYAANTYPFWGGQ
jgi:hypothetical protein